MFDHGISQQGNILDVGIEMGIVNKAGAFFSYGDTRLGQGRESAKGYLKDNPDLAKEIEEKIRASAGTAHLVSSEED